MSRVVAGAALLALVAAACGGGRAEPRGPAGNQAPPPVDAAGPDVALLTGLADGLAETLSTMATITTEAPDCATMAAELTRLFDQARVLFDLADAQSADPAAVEVLRRALDERAARVQPLVEQIGRGLTRCQTDPDVAAAMERMPTF